MSDDKKNDKLKVTVKELDLSELLKNPSGDVNAVVDMIGIDVPEEVKDAIKGIIKDKVAKDGVGAQHSIHDAHAELAEYKARVKPAVGALVVRNKHGEKAYGSPKSEKGEAAMVVEHWDCYKNVGDCGCPMANGVVAIASEGGVRTFAVDLNLFDVAPAATDVKTN